MKIDLFSTTLFTNGDHILREQKDLVSGSVKWQIFLTLVTFAYVYVILGWSPDDNSVGFVFYLCLRR